MKHSRIIAATALTAALAVGGVGVASAHRDDHASGLFTLRPDPAANPEGIAVANRGAFFVSDTGDGSIFKGSPSNPTVSPYIPGRAGGSAVGLKIRQGKLYVAGGSTGKITVYDLASKQAIASFDTGSGGFLNDLAVTRGGDVYVTDSNRPTLWHVTAAQVQAGSGQVQALDVSKGIAYGSGFNLNGIVAKGADRLVVVQTNTGKLFRIDLSGAGDAIDAIDQVQGVSVPGGDGMLLDRGRLVVVQGGPPAQLTFVKLRDDAASGTVEGTRTSALLKGPSTIARDGRLYLVVNADFATSTKPFTVAGLSREDDGRAAARHDRRDDPAGHDRGDDHGHDVAGHDRGDDHGRHHGGRGRG